MGQLVFLLQHRCCVEPWRPSQSSGDDVLPLRGHTTLQFTHVLLQHIYDQAMRYFGISLSHSLPTHAASWLRSRKHKCEAHLMDRKGRARLTQIALVDSTPSRPA